MHIEQYDPKTPLSYLAIISDFLRQHADFKSTSDIINHFGAHCMTDVTDAPEREALKSIQLCQKVSMRVHSNLKSQQNAVVL